MIANLIWELKEKKMCRFCDEEIEIGESARHNTGQDAESKRGFYHRHCNRYIYQVRRGDMSLDKAVKVSRGINSHRRERIMVR